MAQLIPINELNQLHSAAEVKAVAADAHELHIEQSVAYAINNAANTGEDNVQYDGYISPALESKLKAQGYVITKLRSVTGPSSKISWE